MVKVQKISEIQPTLRFSEFDIYRDYEKSFRASELGKIHSLFPFSEISRKLDLREKSNGRKSYFTPEGKIALMLLKSYTGFSDRDLINNLNANLHYQFFCGVRIHPLNPLTNFKIISEIRCEIGKRLDIDSLQEVLASHWKPFMENTGILFTDATCYESNLRYPTDVKLLWESVDWVYHQLKRLVHSHKGRMPRTKYDKQALRYRLYSKKRKRTQTETRVLKRSLLHLLDKLIPLLQEAVSCNKMTGVFHQRLSIISKVLKQQQSRFQGGEVRDLIISIDKSYIRPVVRGKEIKRVEFGAKVNTLQVDGINFIEHISFDPFHEGIRLPQCIAKQQKLFRKRVSHLAADRIYATNYNRKYCSSRKITTSFIRKGRESPCEAQNQQMRNLLNKERSTRLEGSFGTEKQHYSLDKIKARTKQTEILWIFFGIHTANAVRMIPKLERAKIKQCA